MPGYGLLPATDGAGLLPWSWAQERLESSHNYWLATTRLDGRPHVMPLWGIWIDESFAFSTGRRSVKARNLRRNPWCVVTTEDASAPVVVEGEATLVADARTVRRLSGAYAAKYGAAPPDPTEGPMFVLTPTRAFGLIEREEDFAGSATRWIFS
jgi:PPOX class probable F420-dependent enzyme